MHKKGGVRIPRKSITNGATGRAHVESDWSWPIQSVTDWSQRWPFKLWLSHNICTLCCKSKFSPQSWFWPQNRKFVFWDPYLLSCLVVKKVAAKIKPIKSGCFWQTLVSLTMTSNDIYVGIFFNCLFNELTSLFLMVDYLTFSWEDPVFYTRSFILGYYTDWRQSILCLEYLKTVQHLLKRI